MTAGSLTALRGQRRFESTPNLKQATYLPAPHCFWDDELDRRPRDFLELPPEVWSKIFLFTAYIPGAFDLTNYEAIAEFTRDRHGISANNRLTSSLNTKLALSLVCKSWNVLVQRVIFEYICIKNGAQALALAAVLHGKADDLNPVQGPGWWTLRVEIALEGVHIWTSEHTDAVLYILGNCPNLVCFSTIFSTAEPHVYSCIALIESLRHHRELKRVELKMDKWVLERTSTFLAGFLEVLWMLPCRRFSEGDNAHHAVFPRLRILVSGTQCEQLVKKLSLPNLRACIIDHSITSVLPVMNGGIIEFLAASDLGSMLPMLRFCPNLTTISIKYRELASDEFVWNTEPKYPSVQCIMIEDLDLLRREGWYGLATYDSQDTYANVHLNLSKLVSLDLFPELKSLKLFLPVHTKEKVTAWFLAGIRDIWRRLLTQCSTLNIRVEVSQGSEEWTANTWQPLAPDGVYDLL
ncbi:hypothetical protein B0H34DRAFT_805974 [Crassisporium funariophilum]|nr:hypothetical protein B0H34DRAFT_805974 [Crassisporium funariophilum]